MKRVVPRKFTRKLYLGNVLIRPLAGGSAFSASALNLSRAGMGLFSSRFLGVGQPVELLLRGRADGSRAAGHRFQGRVAHACVESDGNVLGVSFATILSVEEMQALEANLGIKAATV